jgi:hypothetical protein
MLLAKSRRRKERQQKDPLCDSSSLRETVLRISVVSVTGVFCRVINFEQTSRPHLDIMKFGKQTSRTGRFCATGLNAAVRMPRPRVWTVAMFA